jgi:hypothetical protein
MTNKEARAYAKTLVDKIESNQQKRQDEVAKIVQEIAFSGGWKWFAKTSTVNFDSVEVDGTASTSWQTDIGLLFKLNGYTFLLAMLPPNQGFNEWYLFNSGYLLVKKEKILELAPTFYEDCPQDFQDCISILIDIDKLDIPRVRERTIEAMFEKQEYGMMKDVPCFVLYQTEEVCRHHQQLHAEKCASGLAPEAP